MSESFFERDLEKCSRTRRTTLSKAGLRPLESVGTKLRRAPGSPAIVADRRLFWTASAIFIARSGGTAFPISFIRAELAPENVKSSGNVCRRAHSLTVRHRSSVGMDALVSCRTGNSLGGLIQTQTPKSGGSPTPLLRWGSILDTPKRPTAVTVVPVRLRQISHRLARPEGLGLFRDPAPSGGQNSDLRVSPGAAFDAGGRLANASPRVGVGGKWHPAKRAPGAP